MNLWRKKEEEEENSIKEEGGKGLVEKKEEEEPESRKTKRGFADLFFWKKAKKKEDFHPAVLPDDLVRFHPDVKEGLSSKQVFERQEQGYQNVTKSAAEPKRPRVPAAVATPLKTPASGLLASEMTPSTHSSCGMSIR